MARGMPKENKKMGEFSHPNICLCIPNHESKEENDKKDMSDYKSIHHPQLSLAFITPLLSPLIDRRLELSFTYVLVKPFTIRY
jgi:hypothetical protein